MACLLIVDDDAENAAQLASLIQAELPGCHDIVCIQGLADFRRIRRRHKPDLVLVELLRQHSNGFTLAAALARQCTARVVLISDRDQGADRVWASARGLIHVLSRRIGLSEFVAQIDSLLHTGFLLARQQEIVQPGPREDLPKALAYELTTSPEHALSGCLAVELHQRHLVDAGNILSIPGHERDRHCWLRNLLVYISDMDIRNVLQSLIRQSGTTSGTAGLHARENALLLLEPGADVKLRILCVEQWLLLRQTLQEQVDGGERQLSQCQQLGNALTFLQDAQACAGFMQNDPDIGSAMWVELVERVLFPASADEALKTLVNTECLRILGSLESATGGVNRVAVRDLVRLSLLLRATTTRQYWQPVLKQSLSAMYRWRAGQPDPVPERLISLILSLLCQNTGQSDDVASGNAGCRDCLPAAVAHKLSRSLGEIAQLLAGEVPHQQRMSFFMVTVYKLRSWIALAGMCQSCEDKTRGHWELAVGCLYEIACHGALKADGLTRADMHDISKFLGELQHCSQQGRPPPENTLINLAALEITIAGRSACDVAVDHQLLAAGLHRLPKPDRIVSDMLQDIKNAGTVLSEIIHELVLLTEGAHRLGVSRVESLVRLLLDCYQQVANQPALLQRKKLRLALGRAHRVLCRLLDQAAAWLPLDQTGSGLAVQTVIDELFTQFDYSSSKTMAPETAVDGKPTVAIARSDWVRCQSLNWQLRQLVRRSANLSDYRSLMSGLLREQQAVIAPHLRYQSSD